MTDSLAAIEARKAFAEALAELQLKLPVIRKAETGKVEGQNKEGKHFSYEYKYADLAGISAAIMPLMGELGLSFMARPVFVGEPLRFALVCTLMHVSGESMEAQYPLPQQGTPQQIGSAITYGRRYCLCAMTGVAPEDDDDDARAASRAEETSAAEMQHAVDAVRGAWMATFGPFAQGDAEKYYARWSKGESLRAASAARLRAFAAFLSNLPPADAGSDPATVPAGEDDRPRFVGHDQKMTAKQNRMMQALFAGVNLRDAAEQRTFIGEVLGTPIKSRGDLTPSQAGQVIDALNNLTPGGAREHADKPPLSGSSRSGEPAQPGTHEQEGQ